MYQAETIRPGELNARDRQDWIGLLSAGSLRSPLFHPDFALVVGRQRADARLLLVRDRQGLAAVFAHHRRPDGFARPIGSVFSDLHAVPMRPGLGLRMPDLLRMAGVKAFRFAALADAGSVRFDPAHGHHTTLAAVVTGDPADFLAQRTREHPKKFKSFRRLARKLETEQGPVRLTISRQTSDLATLLEWKREQFRASGRHDVLSPAWARSLMKRLLEKDGRDVKGRLIVLEAGGRMIAAEFGPCWGGVFHPWLAAYAPDWRAYSPGHLLVMKLIEAMPELGLERYEMGPGCADYKKYFASERTPVHAGTIHAPGLQGRLGHHGERVWRGGLRLCGNRIEALAARAQRRMDVIAAAETNAFSRLMGVTRAAGAMLRND
jgi:CelD/BcsL family acetyltransferase involved in cellulose biosynthesis